ncbi:MAG TPA: hypothetical protein VFS24_18885 [Steroidobacteraceae bacterium]|nr:hypothetical protein [Steroidobacteraceae bacterium]
MNPLRLALVASVAGVSLWGLFSLLDNLRKPELLRTQKVNVIKGCEPMESDEAQRLCPHLQCEKALLDSKSVARSAQFQITVDRKAATMQLIGGMVGGSTGASSFACLIDNRKVVSARLLDSAELETLAAQDGDWSL